MKIFRNIPGAVKVYSNLRYLNGFKREIDDAKAKGDQEREMENICYAISTWGDKLSKSLGMDIKVYGKENLPEKGPVVFMSNHQGYADILALCAAIDTVQFGFVAKKELAKIPLYGKWMDRIRSVMMDRDNPKESLKAITKGIGLLKKGYSLVIFPEGTRSKGGPMIDFKPGSMKLATKPKVPIIPVSIEGSYKIFEERGIISPGTVKVMFHPAIPTDDLPKDSEKHINDKVHDIIKSGVEELRNQ